MSDDSIESGSYQNDDEVVKSKDHGEITNRIHELSSILSDPATTDEEKEKILGVIVSSTTSRAYSYRGVLPPPEILKGYDELVANGAERIVAMAENQSNHRMQLENFAVREQLKQSSRGQWLGSVLGCLALGVTCILALTGHDVVAGAIGTTTVVGLVTAFIKGRPSEKEEHTEK